MCYWYLRWIAEVCRAMGRWSGVQVPPENEKPKEAILKGTSSSAAWYAFTYWKKSWGIFYQNCNSKTSYHQNFKSKTWNLIQDKFVQDCYNFLIEFLIRTSSVHLVEYHKSKRSIIFNFICPKVVGGRQKQIAFDSVSQ